MLRALGVVAAVVACAWLAPQAAEACRCASTPLDAEAIASYDVIFEGTVRVVVRAVGGGQRAAFEVHRVWRGEVGRRATVHVGEDTCRNHVERGERLVVFAQGSTTGHLFVKTCSHTWRRPDLAALGEGVPRSEARCDAGGGREAWVVVMPLLLVRRRRTSVARA